MRILAFKFEKVCGREFFKLLKITAFKIEKVCARKFFECVKESSLSY